MPFLFVFQAGGLVNEVKNVTINILNFLKFKFDVNRCNWSIISPWSISFFDLVFFFSIGNLTAKSLFHWIRNLLLNLEPFTENVLFDFIGYNSWACKRRDSDLIINVYVNDILEIRISIFVNYRRGGGLKDMGTYFLLW